MIWRSNLQFRDMAHLHLEDLQNCRGYRAFGRGTCEGICPYLYFILETYKDYTGYQNLARNKFRAPRKEGRCSVLSALCSRSLACKATSS